MRRAFTLVEILVVISIIGVISSFAVNSFKNAQEQSTDSKRKEALKVISAAAVQFYQDNDYYPGNSANPAQTAFSSDTGDSWIPDLVPYFDDNTVPKDPLAGIFTNLAQNTKEFIGVNKDINTNPQVAGTQTVNIPASITDAYQIRSGTTNPTDNGTCNNFEAAWNIIGMGRVSGGTYYAYRSYLTFDTSSIPSTASINSVTLSLGVNRNFTTTDFTLNSRNYNWGNSIDCADWGGDPPTSVLNGSFNTASLPADNTNFSFALNTRSVTKAGLTSMMLTSSREESNIDICAGCNEYLEIHSQNSASVALRPLISVTYTTPDPSPTPTPITATPTPSPPTVTCEMADVNDSGFVDLTDTLATLDAMNYPYNPNYDMDNSGFIDLTDVLLVNEHVGETCTTPSPSPSPSSLSYQIQTSSDDVSRGNSGFWTNSSDLAAGKPFNSGDGFRSSAMRFTSVTVPKNATITSAKLTFIPRDTNSETGVNTKISAEASDNPGQITGISDWNARSHTTSSVNWNNISAWTSGTSTQSIDFSSVVQEIVNRSGWVSGNSLMIFWEDNASSANAGRVARSRDFSLTDAPKLDITYTTGPPGIPPTCSPSSQNVNIGQSATLNASAGNGTFSWSAPGGSPSSGNGSTFNVSFATSGTKTVTVTSGGLDAICSVNVASAPSPTPSPVPTANITAAQTTIPYDSGTIIVWTSKNTDSCTVTPPGGSTTTSGSFPTGNLTANRTYSLSCTGPNGNASGSVTIIVQGAASAPPTPIACQDKRNVFCYIVSADKKSFQIWATLDNLDDVEIYNKTDALCKLTPPVAPYNFCVESPKL